MIELKFFASWSSSLWSSSDDLSSHQIFCDLYIEGVVVHTYRDCRWWEGKETEKESPPCFHLGSHHPPPSSWSSSSLTWWWWWWWWWCQTWVRRFQCGPLATSGRVSRPPSDSRSGGTATPPGQRTPHRTPSCWSSGWRPAAAARSWPRPSAGSPGPPTLLSCCSAGCRSPASGF